MMPQLYPLFCDLEQGNAPAKTTKNELTHETSLTDTTIAMYCTEHTFTIFYNLFKIPIKQFYLQSLFIAISYYNAILVSIGRYLFWQIISIFWHIISKQHILCSLILLTLKMECISPVRKFAWVAIYSGKFYIG